VKDLWELKNPNAERVWQPGTVRLTFNHTGDDAALRDGQFDLTFCPTCASRVDETDFYHLEDLIWKSWKSAWESIGMTGRILEAAVAQRRGFKLLSIDPMARWVDFDGEWQPITLEEIRIGGNEEK